MHTQRSDERVCQVCPDGINHPVREMEEPHGPIDHREPQSNQGINATGDQAVDEKIHLNHIRASEG